MKAKHQVYTVGTFFLLAGVVALVFYLNESEQLPELLGIGYLGWYAVIFFIVGLAAMVVGLFVME